MTRPLTPRPSFGAALLTLALLSGAAQADTYWVNGNVNASAKFALPGQPFTISNNLDQFAAVDSPQALLSNDLAKESSVAQGGSKALVRASIGSLKTYSSANYQLGIGPQNGILFTGDAFGYAAATFVDRVAVSSPGLPLGTPVSYQVKFSIDGLLSTPSFEQGGYLSARAEAKATLREVGSGGQVVNFDWNSMVQSPGIYSLTLNTVVGRTLEFSGSLNTTASVTWQAQTGRAAYADFYHSALYTLVPSVAGLNTTGASGYNFLAPVPESSTAALMALGLAAVGFARRHASARHPI